MEINSLPWCNYYKLGLCKMVFLISPKCKFHMKMLKGVQQETSVKYLNVATETQCAISTLHKKSCAAIWFSYRVKKEIFVMARNYGDSFGPNIVFKPKLAYSGDKMRETLYNHLSTVKYKCKIIIISVYKCKI